jgi:hypothetical protein
MTPEELQQNYFNVCYYYACGGNPNLNIPYNFSTSYNSEEGNFIESWNFLSPSQPTDSDLLLISFDDFTTFNNQIIKNQKIQRIMEQDDYPLLDYIYTNAGLNLITIMNQIL